MRLLSHTDLAETGAGSTPIQEWTKLSADLCASLQGRMCLLLAPPASGKSTLLKVLSGKIQDGGLLKVSASSPAALFLATCTPEGCGSYNLRKPLPGACAALALQLS